MDELKRPLLILVLLIVVFSSLITVYLLRAPRFDQPNLKPFEGAGSVLAQETVRRFANGARILVLVPEGAHVVPKTILRSLRKEIQEYPDLLITAVEQWEPFAAIVGEPDQSYDPGERFMALVSDHEDIQLVISLAGLPQLSDDQKAALKLQQFTVFVLATAAEGVEQLIEEDIVQLAIVPRDMAVDPSDEIPQNPLEWFDTVYRVAAANSAGHGP